MIESGKAGFTPLSGTRLTGFLSNAVEVTQSELAPKIDPASQPVMPRVIWKAVVYRESLSHRTIELASAVVDCLKSGNFLGSAILARCLCESSAAMNELHHTIMQAQEHQDRTRFDQKLMRLLTGTRSAGAEYPAMNILTSIDRLDRKIGGFRALYDDLSEIAHPNCAGNADLFSLPKAALSVEFGRYPNGPGEIERRVDFAVRFNLHVFESTYNDMEKWLQTLTVVFEERA